MQMREAAAELLRVAERDRAPIKPLVELYPGDRRGRRVRDPAAQHPAPQPGRGRAQGRPVVAGHAADDGRRRAGLRPPARRHAARRAPPTRRAYLYPRVEVEVGFVLSHDLPGEGCTDEDVLAATEFVAPAIELIDSRIVDWRIRLPDTIADNASSAGFVLGRERVRPSEMDLRGDRRVVAPQR